MNNQYTINITPLAKRDIASILDYIEFVLHNKTAAKKQHEAFLKTFDYLQSTPYIYPLLQNIFVTESNIRKAVVNRYIIFFEINEELKTISIFRVLYESRNYTNLI